jgi:hypothetical protein
MQKENKGNLPEKKFRAGAISATVWKNETKSKTGEDIAYYTVSIERSYKDKNDQWQTTQSFRVNDLPRLALVVNKAYEYLNLKDIDVFDVGSPSNKSIPDEEIVM